MQLGLAHGHGNCNAKCHGGCGRTVPMMAGAAASLQGFAMMAAGALSSLILSRLGAGVVSLGLMMCTLAGAGIAIFVWATRQHSATPT
jgi:hypothetical protein